MHTFAPRFQSTSPESQEIILRHVDYPAPQILHEKRALKLKGVTCHVPAYTDSEGSF